MKGLLIKDLISMKQQGRIFALIVGLWLVMSIAQKDVSFFGGVMMIFSVMVPITAMAYDERAKWDRYVLTMPVSRKEIVIAKYLLGLLFIAGSIIVTAVLNAALSNSFIDFIPTAAGFLSVGLLFLAMLMPLMYKFGVEKGRMMLMLVALIPAVLVFVVPHLQIPQPDQAMLTALMGTAPLIGLILVALSALLSIRIYRKKEF